MDLIGKSSIHPVLFYSGKISGYITWIILFLLLMRINVLEKYAFGYNDYLSYLLLSIGLGFIFISLFNLGASTRLGLPTEATELKTHGLYRISRNPMYLGFNLITLASIIYTLNIWMILLGIYSIIIYHLIILGEERFLENRFGEAYRNYKSRIRRYL